MRKADCLLVGSHIYQAFQKQQYDLKNIVTNSIIMLSIIKTI